MLWQIVHPLCKFTRSGRPAVCEDLIRSLSEQQCVGLSYFIELQRFNLFGCEWGDPLFRCFYHAVEREEHGDDYSSHTFLLGCKPVCLILSTLQADYT